MLTGSCFSDSGHYDYVPNLKYIYVRTTLNDPSRLYVCVGIYVCKNNNYKGKFLNLDGSAGAQLRTCKKKRDEYKRYQYSMHIKNCQNNFKIN